MKPFKKSETYETPDLNLAAFLRANTVKFLGIRWEGSRAFFKFEEARAYHFSLEFMNNASVPISQFINAQRDLRALVIK